MNFLRQSTASQGRTIGSMVDNTDGSSVENGLTIANTDIKLKKNGATAVNKNSGGGTSDVNGMYGVTFNATDTDTVGELNVSILIAGVLVAWKDFFVLTQAAYDLFYAAASTGLVTANLIQINGATLPVSKLEDQYDGTGNLDETAPASRSQVGAIGTVAGSGLPFEVIGDNTGGAIKGITFVGSQVGTFANIEAANGSYHVITHVGNAIDIVYRVNVGGSRIASQLDFQGFLNSSNDEINIMIYDFVTPGWDTLVVLGGQNGSDNTARIPKILGKHTGTGADLGDVLIRYQTTGQTAPVLNVDQLLADTSGITSAIGFLGGAVWLDTTGGGTAGTGEGVGFYNRPSSNITDTLAIAAANGLKIIQSLPGTSFILPSSGAGLEFKGFSYTATLNGKSVSGTKFKDAIILGNDSGTNAIHTIYDGCRMGSNTLGLHDLHNRCELSGDIILAEAGTYTWVDPVSHIAGSGAPSVDFEAAIETKALNVRGMFGGLEIRNYNAGGGTHTMTLGGTGQRIFAASCAGGSLEQRGQWKETDNAGGAVAVVRDKVSQGIIDTEEDTNELQADWTDGGRLDNVLDARMAETSISTTAGAVDLVTANSDMRGTDDGALAVDLAGVNAIVSAILTDTDITIPGLINALNDPTAVTIAIAVWDRIISKANHDIGQSAAKILRQSGDLVQIDGAVSDASPATTGFNTTLTQADGYFEDAVMIFSNGSANAGIGRPVSTYLNASGAVTFALPDDWPVTVINGDDFVIYATHVHPVSQIADAVADEALSGHATAGTLGRAITDIETIVTAVLEDTGVTIPDLIAALNNISTADVLASGDVDGYSLEKTLKIILAMAAGKLSGATTPTLVFRAADDSKARITGTVDGIGNRTAVVLDGDD